MKRRRRLTGPKDVSRGSGVIFEACNTGSTNTYYVLTSAIIIRPTLNAIKNRNQPAAPLLEKSLVRDDQSNDEKPPTASILDDEISNQSRPAAPLLEKSLDQDDQSNDEKPPIASIPDDEISNQRRPSTPLLEKSLVRDDPSNNEKPTASILDYEISNQSRPAAPRDNESNDEKRPTMTIVDDEIISQMPPTTSILSPSAGGGDETNDSLDSILRDKKLDDVQDDGNSSETTFLRDDTSSDDSSSEDSCMEEIFVYLSNGETCTGEILVSDNYYNIAVLKIQSASQLLTAHLRPVDDYVDTGFCRSANGQDSLKLVPGDAVIAVGRYYENQHEIMASPGKYSGDEFVVKYACKDLLRANCKIDIFGIGGPLITHTGEVIGINFYAEHFTPFLPINIFLKWWEYYKVNQNYRRPWVGVQAAKLFAPPVRVWESIRELNIFHGVVIKKVLPGSPAEAAGIHPFDIIVKCAGRSVRSFLEFVEIIWDETGEVVDIEVIRNGISLEMKIQVKARH